MLQRCLDEGTTVLSANGEDIAVESVHVEGPRVIPPTTGIPATTLGNRGTPDGLQVGTWLKGVMDRVIPAPERPKFSGHVNENRLCFLELLRRFGKAFGLSDRGLLDLARDCLLGDAKAWTPLYKDTWSTLSDLSGSEFQTEADQGSNY